MKPIHLNHYRGDTITHTIALKHPKTGAAFDPSPSYNLLFTLSADTDDADASAIAQKTTGTGITVSGTNAIVELVGVDTEAHVGRRLIWFVRATHVTTGARLTVAVGTLQIDPNTGRETTPTLPIKTTDPSDAFANTAQSIHAADTLDTIPDGAEFGFTDPDNSFGLVKSTWTNIKAKLATYFVTIFDPIGSAAAAQATAISVASFEATNKAVAAQDYASRRVNHIGTQATSTITGLDAALAARSLVADIRNNLTSVETDKPLSAAQGKALKDAIDSINLLLASDEIALDTLQEIVDFIQLNREDLDSLSIASIAGLQAALDTKLNAASNLSDLQNAATARTNLGLGSAATHNVPAAGNATAGEVVKGNDTRLSDDRSPTAAGMASKIDAAIEHTTLADTDRFAMTVGGALRWLSPSRIAAYIVGQGRTLTGAWVFSGSATARLIPRVTTIMSSATPTINTDNCDCVTITAQAEAITSMTANLSGTPNNFDQLLFRIKDNGTARAITWGASFVARGGILPSTTVSSKVWHVLFIRNSVTSTWDCVSSSLEV